MSKAADEAFQRARERIAQAKREGWTTLELIGPELEHLETLPEEISDLLGLKTLRLWETNVHDLSRLSYLTELRSLHMARSRVMDLSPLRDLKDLVTLDFGFCPVSDLSPIKNLKKLRYLYLPNTRVSDLTPLNGLNELQAINLERTSVDLKNLKILLNNPKLIPRNANTYVGPYGGVWFKGSEAAKANRKLAGIAGINEDRERTAELFSYLRIEAAAEEPAPDPLIPSLVEDGRLEIPSSFPSPHEQDERLKHVLHDRLRPKAADCAQKAGNTFPGMARMARVLASLLDRPFEELDLLAVHLEIEDIEARAKLGSEDGVPYEADLLAVVGDVTRLGPGLTRGNADVELFHERLLKTRDTPIDAVVEAARAALSEAILADPSAHGPRSLAMEARLKEAVDPNVARALREPKHRNLLWRLGSVAALAVSRVGKDLASDTAGGLIKYALGPAITAFVVKNWGMLMEVAATYGVGFASWIAGTVGLLMIGKGVKEERDKRKRRDEDDGAL